MSEAVAFLGDATFWAGVVMLAVPLVMGVLGAQLCAAAGVVNLGAEGLFALGAATALVLAHHGTGVGVALGLAASIALVPGLLLGLLADPRGPPPALSGLAVTLLCGTAAAALGAAWLATGPAPVTAAMAPLPLPRLSAIPYVGSTVFTQLPTTYLAVGMALAVTYLLHRMPLGLAIRACGDNPVTLTVQGRSALAIRTATVMAGSGLIAVAGACQSLTAAQPWSAELVAGRGFLCVAIALVAGPRITLGAIAAVAAALLAMLQPRLATVMPWPSELGLLVPLGVAVVTLIAVRRDRRSWWSSGA